MGLSEPCCWFERERVFGYAWQDMCVGVHSAACVSSQAWAEAETLPISRQNGMCGWALRTFGVQEPAGLAEGISAFFLPTVLCWRHAESAGFCVLWDQHQVSAQVLEWELWVTPVVSLCFMKMKRLAQIQLSQIHYSLIRCFLSVLSSPAGSLDSPAYTPYTLRRCRLMLLDVCEHG